MNKHQIRLNLTNLDDRIVPTVDLTIAVDAAPQNVAVLRAAPADVGVFVGDASGNAPEVIHVDSHDPIGSDVGVYVGLPDSAPTAQAADILSNAADVHPPMVGSFLDVIKKSAKTVAGVIDSALTVVIPTPVVPTDDPLAGNKTALLQLKDLKVGDMLLFDARGVVSTGIQVFTNGHYNHAAVYAGDGMIIHAVTSGVEKVKLSDYIAKSSGLQRVMVVRVGELSIQEQRDMVSFLNRQVGKSYNNIGAATVMTNNRAFTGLVNIIGERDAERPDYYCSQLVAAAYKAVNRPLFKTIEQSPGDLSELVRNGKAINAGCLYRVNVHNGL